ncbi:hypothetical protein [Ponticaulis sp.]|uniref:hypothetical protein n=1 Tax=Ponticaulis sp. TaxID=2020902 RepID=UPI000C992068|nr:hypothetical protein [Ponticaulis sp.]MAI89997.1 hypothetical protein [Ponticaulis sp.]
MFKNTLLVLGAMALFGGAAFADGCATTSSESISFGDNYIIEAVAIGDTCEHSIAVIVVRDGDGAPQYTEASPTQFLFGFDGVSTEQEMAGALDEYIGVPMMDGGVFSSAELPDWPEGADYPGDEFPFYPEEWVDRAEYLRLQSLEAPVWCHVQGMESSSCLVLDGEYLYKIGVQSFPG